MSGVMSLNDFTPPPSLELAASTRAQLSVYSLVSIGNIEIIDDRIRASPAAYGEVMERAGANSCVSERPDELSASARLPCRRQ